MPIAVITEMDAVIWVLARLHKLRAAGVRENCFLVAFIMVRCCQDRTANVNGKVLLASIHSFVAAVLAQQFHYIVVATRNRRQQRCPE